MVIFWMQAAAAAMMALAALLHLGRIARTTSPADRILALDAVALTVVGYLLLQGDRTGGHFYLDAALALALLSFVATIALARALPRGDGDD